MNSIDARPVLRLENAECVHTVAPLVLKVMVASGDFSLRIRHGVKPALWSMDGRGRLFPVRIDWLRAWIDMQFRCYDQFTGRFIKCSHNLASWVLRVELGDPCLARSHGLFEMTDEIASLIGGAP